MSEDEKSFSDSTGDSQSLKLCSQNGRLEDVKQIILANQHSIKVLSMTLLWSCKVSHLDIVKWLMENTEANVNYIKKCDGIHL